MLQHAGFAGLVVLRTHPQVDCCVEAFSDGSIDTGSDEKMTMKTQDEWYDRFEDALESSDGTTFFNNAGQDLVAVQAADVQTVWSIVEGDEGIYLLPGFHMVNNIGYVLSALPITDEELASGEWNEIRWDDGSEPGVFRY